MSVPIAAATANPAKLAEIEEIFAAVAGDAFTLLPRPAGLADVDETGETLRENAELKARAVSVAAGTAALADDTGLEVDALDGAPGVRSARFAGEAAVDADNVALLLSKLSGVDASGRTARFRTVICLVGADGGASFADGVCEGRIAEAPR
ncbi:MAG: non-canonical purine NTP pyrophosphatase [Acidimicrobiales bacterium]